MHDGSLATLADVVEFYDKGGEPNPHLSLEMQRLELTASEKTDLVEFLRALSGEVREGP
jgi:cytochrome c peroxidase